MQFDFSTEYQQELISFIVLDKQGLNLLNKLDDTFFSLDYHAVIVKAIKSFHKEFRRVPTETLLKDRLAQLFKTRELAEALNKNDRRDILKMVTEIFSAKLKHPDILYSQANKFISYTNLTHIIETTDLKDYQQYDSLAKKIRQAITEDSEVVRLRPQFLIKDISDRQFRRQDFNPIIPTPWRQVNESTNAGGYAKGGIIVILDEPKKFKTGMLINAARLLLRRKKKILMIDLENGEDELLIRTEESIKNYTKRQILSGELDNSIRKTLRKYQRLGAEFAVKRLPALSSTANDIQDVIDYSYQEYGIQYDDIIIDYLGLLGSISGQKDDKDRIAQAYLDVANLAARNNIDHVYTAHHVTREASKRAATRYTSNDIAKCIDIVRHVQAIWGLNRTEDEVDQNVFRMELVEQRDGKPYAKALFHVNLDTQKAEEFTKEQRREYDNQTSGDPQADGGGDLN